MENIEELKKLLAKKRHERNDLIFEKKKWQDSVNKLSILLDKLKSELSITIKLNPENISKIESIYAQYETLKKQHDYFFNNIKRIEIDIQIINKEINELRSSINKNSSLQKNPSLCSSKIDWEKVNNLSLEKKVSYFINLANTILDEQQVKDSSDIKDPFKDTLFTCYNELKKLTLMLKSEKKQEKNKNDAVINIINVSEEVEHISKGQGPTSDINQIEVDSSLSANKTKDTAYSSINMPKHKNGQKQKGKTNILFKFKPLVFAGSLAIIASANLKQAHSLLLNPIVLGNATCSLKKEETNSNLEDLKHHVPPEESIHTEFIMDRYELERLEEIERRKEQKRKEAEEKRRKEEEQKRKLEAQQKLEEEKRKQREQEMLASEVQRTSNNQQVETSVEQVYQQGQINYIKKFSLTSKQIDTIKATVQHEAGFNQTEVYAVMSVVINRCKSGNWGASNPYSVITFPGQFASYLNGYYRQYINENYADYTDQIIDEMLKGERAPLHNYESFRSSSSTVGVQFTKGGNKYR